MKRFIAIFMTLCLMLGLSTISVWADEVTNEWQNETSMSIQHKDFGSCSLGDRIYVVGSGTSVETYYTKTQSWGKIMNMPESTYRSKAVAIGNKMYVIGTVGSDHHTIMQIYDSSTKKWTVKNDIPYFPGKYEITAIGEKIYVVNTKVVDGEHETGIDVYDTVSDEWTSSTSKASKARYYMGICAAGTSVYVVGGKEVISNKEEIDLLEVYDTTTDTWKTASSMPTARKYTGVVMVGNKMYVMGGITNNKVTDIVEIYDTKTNSWTMGPSLKTARGHAGAVTVDRKIYAIGGQGTSSPYLQSIEFLQVDGSSEDPTTKLSVLLNQGENVQLSTSYDLGNNKNFTWSSTNEAVATVDSNGKVTAVAEGTADIYAQNADGTFKEYIPVKVVEGIADELRLAVHLKSGEKAKLYLTNDPSKVTWSSLDESIANISADGQVTGVKKGLAIVKAELDGQTYQIYVRVNG